MNIKVTPKGEDKADIAVSQADFEEMSQIVQQMFDVVNNSPNGYKLSDIYFLFGFFVANAAEFLNKQVPPDGNGINGDSYGWVDAISAQAKVWIKNFSNRFNVNSIS